MSTHKTFPDIRGEGARSRLPIGVPMGWLKIRCQRGSSWEAAPKWHTGEGGNRPIVPILAFPSLDKRERDRASTVKDAAAAWITVGSGLGRNRASAHKYGCSYRGSL